MAFNRYVDILTIYNFDTQGNIIYLSSNEPVITPLSSKHEKTSIQSTFSESDAKTIATVHFSGALSVNSGIHVSPKGMHLVISYRTELIRPCPGDCGLLEGAEYYLCPCSFEVFWKRIYLSTAKTVTIYLKRVTRTESPTEYSL